MLYLRSDVHLLLLQCSERNFLLIWGCMLKETRVGLLEAKRLMKSEQHRLLIHSTKLKVFWQSFKCGANKCYELLMMLVLVPAKTQGEERSQCVADMFTPFHHDLHFPFPQVQTNSRKQISTWKLLLFSFDDKRWFENDLVVHARPQICHCIHVVLSRIRQ